MTLSSTCMEGIVSNILETRKQLNLTLDRLSLEQLIEVAEFANRLSAQPQTVASAPNPDRKPPVKVAESPLPDGEPQLPLGAPQLRGSTLGDLLQFAGTWEGDDIRACLQLVHQYR